MKSPTITLRPMRESDLENLVKYANNPQIEANLSDRMPYPYTMEEGEKFMKEVLSTDPHNRMVIALEDQMIGLIGIHPQEDIFQINGELGYWLGEPYWGQGFMTEAIKQMIPYAFETFDIQRIFARTFGRNVPSQKVLEKAGFQLDAIIKKSLIKHGIPEDEVIYSVHRDGNL